MSSHVHALNNSPAHQKYSFSKEQRLVYGKPTYFSSLSSTDVYYLPKPDKDRRSALIGSGERSLLGLNDKFSINTPHAYSIPSSINYKKGVSFTSGRHVNWYLIHRKSEVPCKASNTTNSTQVLWITKWSHLSKKEDQSLALNSKILVSSIFKA